MRAMADYSTSDQLAAFNRAVLGFLADKAGGAIRRGRTAPRRADRHRVRA
jgi:hypothetical protein